MYVLFKVLKNFLNSQVLSRANSGTVHDGDAVNSSRK